MFNKDEKYLISKENAEKALAGMFDYFELNIDEIEDKDAKKLILASRDRVIKCIRMGRLEISATNGLTITYKLRTGGETLVITPPSAMAKKAMDAKGRDEFYGRIYALMGACCKLGEDAISKIEDPVDLSIIEVLGSIFLSV